MEFSTLVQTYGGWAALIIYFVYKQAWPLIADKVVPDKLQRERDLLHSRIKSEEDEKEFYRSLQIRQADAMDKLTAAIQTITINIAETNANIANILATQSMILGKQDRTHEIIVAATVDMKSAVGADKRRGDTGTLKNNMSEE